ncbi:reverse transcriptase domain-containing protein [Tanacetum coccineum]
MFLGHVVNMKGIKACPDKAEAVIKLQSPRTLKEVQSLNRKLASLNRFLFKSAEKSLPFFKTLKNCIKKSDFQWTPEAEKEFQDMKQCIAELPMVTAPRPKEELIIYLCVAREAFSAVLLTERDSQQMPVYFVSRALQTPKVNYSSMEKLVLSLLEAFDITYRPRTSIRGQILADFIAERPDEDGPPREIQAEEAIPDPWTLFTDGSSCLEGSGAGLILTNPEGIESYIAKEQSMIQYLEKARTLISSFKKFSIKQVPRSENKKADALSKIASTSFAHLTKQVLVEVLKEKSIEEKEILMVVEEEGDSWMTPLLEYHRDDQRTSGKSKPQPRRRHQSKVGGKEQELGRRGTAVLWAHHTTIKTSNGHTPFSLTYGTEAMIPVEIEMPSLRCAKIDQAMNDEDLLLNLDVLEEEREKPAIQEAKSKAKMKRYYNAKVCITVFKPEDFVYRNNEASHAKESEKLGPKWEGPYEVVEALGKGAYKLRNGSGDILPRAWNVKDLKKCYL